ncbi:MAG: hypothetical protein J7M21_06655, partial [Planctomycetes bacterium]|nr:hypothetical protein [Planctomycetota bacterium]
MAVSGAALASLGYAAESVAGEGGRGPAAGDAGSLISRRGAASRSGRAVLVASGRLCVSGIYPHLAVFNGTYDPAAKRWGGSGGECGIGAVAAWAGRLWLITYPPHETRGGR